MRLLFVRHGESAWNAIRKLQGQADVPLTDRGGEQAANLAPMISVLKPDLAVGSDLVRARETARLLGFPAVSVDPAWREIDVGEWTARDIEDLRRDHGDAYSGWRAGTYTPPGGESWERFCDRVAAAVRRLRDSGARSALIVTHGGVIRAACSTLIGLHPRHVVPVGPGSLTIIDLADEPKLETFNTAPALPVLDAPD